jgi:hypothetical protein
MSVHGGDSRVACGPARFALHLETPDGKQGEVIGMRYASYYVTGPRAAPGLLLEFVAKILRRLVPLANPDFDLAYQSVTLWWLEIDEDGQVRREIGFDAGQRPIAIAPFRENFGVFTDIAGHPEQLGPEQDPSAFEAAWSEVASRFTEATRGRPADGGTSS